MSQPNAYEQLSIHEMPNILKVARQNMALGLYEESMKSYRHALKVLYHHLQTVHDPFLKEQWKKADEEIRTEVKAIYQLYKDIRGLRGEAVNFKDPSLYPSAPAPGRDARPIKPAAMAPPANLPPAQPSHGTKLPPSVLERFGGQPFSNVEKPMDDREEPPAPQPPKKDPIVWDPPSPKHAKPLPQKHKPPKNLPTWAQKKGGGNPPKQPGKPQQKYLQF